MDQLRRKVIFQAASMLLERSIPINFNSNAFDQRRRKHRKKFRRTEKCHLWLRKEPIVSTYSSNAINDETQPLMFIEKKRFRRDEFLSTMQHCLQPPFSSNHFYAFDQMNLLKLQRKCFSSDQNERIDLKRKSSSIEPTPFSSTTKTADDDLHSDPYSSSPTSQMILNRLEKILELCGQLRSVAKDVEVSEEKNVIDIHPELNGDEKRPDENPPMSTASKTKQIRKAEELCRCFLQSFFDKTSSNAEHSFSPDEEEYLSELTRAYLLGREHSLQINVESTTNSIAGAAENNNNTNVVISPSISSTNFKHERFLHEPIGTKTTEVLPGIGAKYAQQLSEFGFNKVRRLLGFYLMIKNDQEFVQWLNNNVKISTHSAALCTNALRAWCQEHL